MGYDCSTPTKVDATNPVCPDGSMSAGRNFSLPGEYYVGRFAHYFHWEFAGTEDPTGGNVLFVDGSNSANDKVWYQDVEIQPNTTYYFSAEVASLGDGTIKPEDVSTLNFTIGGVTIDDISASTTVGEWKAATAVWNSGSNSGQMPLCFTTASTTGCNACNDFAIDNITFVANCQLGDETPLPDLGEDISLCGTGAGVTLDAGVSGTGVTYEWSTGETTPTIDVSTGGSYAVCVKKGTGCPRSDIIEISTDYDISMDDVELCDPPEVELDPGFDGTGVTFAWTKDGQAAGSGSTLTATEAGSYEVTVNDPICGTKTATVEVTSLLVETTDIEYCPGDVTLTATGSTSYNFYENENDVTPIGSGASVVVDRSSGGDHTYWVEDAVRETASGVGPTNSSFSNPATGSPTKRMKIEIFKTMGLESVKLDIINYTGVDQVGAIQLFDETNSGSPVFETPTTVPASAHNGTYTANLGWDIPPGIYYLSLSGAINAKFIEGGTSANTGVPFAYNDSDGEPVFTTLRTTDNQFSNEYNAIYFFYGWEISLPKGCGRVPLNVIDDCPCLKPSAEIDGVSETCPAGTGDDIVIDITPGDAANADSWDITYSIDGVDQTPVTVTSPTYTITDPVIGLYELVSVTEEVSGATCAAQSMTGSGEVTALTPAEVTLSGDATICEGEGTDLTFNFVGTGPFELTWSDGLNETTETGLTNPHTYAVSPTANTTYSIVTVTDAAAPLCPGTDASTAAITVTPQLSTSAPTFTCNANNTGYTVTFDIINATAGTFTVDGDPGTLTGNTFVSDEIAEGATYSFTVNPTGSCDPVPVTGSYECACLQPTAAISGGSSVCQGDTPDNIEIAITEGDASIASEWRITYSIDGVDQPVETVNAPALTIINPTDGDYELVSVIEMQAGSQCPASALSGLGAVEILSPPTVTIAGDADVCQGAGTDLQFTIVGDGPFTLTWSDGTTETTKTGLSNPHTETVTPDATTSYTIVTVTSTSAPQCPATDPSVVTVTVTEPLTADVTSLVCNGTATGYTATVTVGNAQAGEFAVSGDPGTLNDLVFTSDELPKGGTYNFTVEPTSNCPDVVLTGVHDCVCLTDAGTVDATPIVTCAGQSVTVIHDGLEVLDADDGLKYVMHDSPNGTLGNVVGYSDSPTFDYLIGSIVPGTTYYISPIAGNLVNGDIDLTDGCLSNTAGTPVTYNSAPIGGLLGSDSICPGESVEIAIQLEGTPPFDLTITDDLGNHQNFTGIAAAPAPISLTPAVSTTYTITNLTDNSGSSCAFGAVSEAAFVVLPDLQLFAEEHNLTCYQACETGKGHAFVDAASEPFVKASGYTWYDNAGAQIGSGPDISDLCAGDYTVSVTNGHCSATESISIIEPSQVEADASGTNPSCFGLTDGTADATGSGGSVSGTYNYSWDTGANTQGLTALADDTYNVTVTDDSLCSATAQVILTEPQEVLVSINESNVMVCAGQSASITAVGAGGTGSTYTYQWTGDNSIGDPAQATTNITPAVATTYSVIAVDINNCESSPATVDADIYTAVNVEASTDKPTICTNDEATLSYENARGGSGSYDFTWTDVVTSFAAQSSGNPITINDLGSFTYTLTMVDQVCGSFDPMYTTTKNVTISTQGAPDATFTAEATQECDQVVFDYERSSVDNIANETCEWTIFDSGNTATSFTSTNCAGTSATFFNDNEKTARLTISNDIGCSASFVLKDNTPTYPDPEISFFYQPQQLSMIYPEGTFYADDATAGDVNSYTWDFGDGETDEGENAMHEFPSDQAGTYVVTLTGVNQYGCEDTYTEEVYVDGIWTLYAPSAFTPGNNDGMNDEFLPKHVGVSNDVYEFRVFDRWGNVVFESEDPYRGWDGTIEGDPVEATVYTWLVNTVAAYDPGISISKTGRVTVVR